MTAVLSAKRTQSLNRGSVDVIRCSAGDDVYCLEMSVVAGVQPAGDLRLSRQVRPKDPVGTVHDAGRDVPVFDLLELLQVSCDRPPAGHYVVLIEHPIQRYGLRVESVSRVIRLTRENVLPLPKPLEHVGGWFRGIADFTRDRQISLEAFSSSSLPGISEPKPIPANRRRALHQMQLLLNSKTLLPGHEAKPDPTIPSEFLHERYASVAAISQSRAAKQIVVFPAGVVDDRQLMMGVSISQVVEISEPLPPVPIPGVHSRLSGFVQWRNCPVPIIDLQASFGHQTEAGPITHLLILRDHRGGSLIGIPVAGRVQSLRLPFDHRPCALPEKRWTPYVLGAFEMEERLLVLPRLDAISGVAG